jgi:transposase
MLDTVHFRDPGDRTSLHVVEIRLVQTALNYLIARMRTWRKRSVRAASRYWRSGSMMCGWQTIAGKCPLRIWWTLRCNQHRCGVADGWSEAQKREIVAETLEPGSSVSIVARRYDVNANQLFLWRRELLPKPAGTECVAMLPVEVVPKEPHRSRRSDRGGCIEIEFGSGIWVRVRGHAAPEMLRQVVELLR